MELKDIIEVIDFYYPKQLKYDDVDYAESKSHQNFIDLLINKIHDPSSVEYHDWKKNVREIGNNLNKEFIVQTNSQFPVLSCYCSEHIDSGKLVSRINILEISLSLITKVFYVNEYIDNVNIINEKHYRTKSIQIVHTDKYYSSEVKNLIQEVKTHYPQYSFCNHHFLLLRQKDYYPPITDLEEVSLYHLLFGSEPNYQLSIIYGT